MTVKDLIKKISKTIASENKSASRTPPKPAKSQNTLKISGKSIGKPAVVQPSTVQRTSTKSTASSSSNTQTNSASQPDDSDDFDSMVIVAQADAKGRLVQAKPMIKQRKMFKSKANFGNSRVLQYHSSSIEEVQPHLASPRSKPNDIVLLYQDLSELVFTSLSSLVSSFKMPKGDSRLKRRALHEDSQTSLNGRPSSNLDTTNSIMHMQEKNERSGLVMWWRPIFTLWYFILECKTLLFINTVKLWHNKGKVLAFLMFLSMLVTMYNVEGSHQQYIQNMEKKVQWWLYWIILGIMSSVGLGTGLHTFVLYLGPFIAKVTLAAYECKSLDFPQPPYPDSIECPSSSTPGDTSITLWSIMSKVRLEAMMWGVGTAIGELPPYFMARAAKLSDSEHDEDNEDIEEVLSIEEQEKINPNYAKELGILERTKVYMHDMVHKMGFFGILACASIPNPLFDLAGITCGHFLIPFWTFFGATLIGKAVIKMHIQQLVVIFAFSEQHVETFINMLKKIPQIGDKIGQPFRDYLLSQRAKLHKDSTSTETEAPWLGWVFEKLIMIMVIYFVISIINSFAQKYHKRLCMAKRKQPGAKLK